MLITGVALSWMVGQMAKGKLSNGDLALLLQSLWLAQGTLYYLLGNLSKTYQNLLYLQDLFEFLALQPKIPTSLKSPQPPAWKGGFRSYSSP